MNPYLAQFLVRIGLLSSDRLRILVSARRVRIEAALLVDCPGDPNQPVKPINFLIDSGCSVSTMGLTYARNEGIPTGGHRVPRRRTGSTGTHTVTVVEGTFRFRLSDHQRA